ncbi:MAG: pyruvate formate-lyase activating enzyme [Syntrophobacterales bacterium]|nr:MAG: pyruvate formate-lyase activating enzyme [Syntrophobacterales bacterium]
MARFLAIDVGASTLDAMFLDTSSGDQFKFVVKSPTRSLSERLVACKSSRIVITGHQMGGGFLTEVIKTKAQQCRIMMTPSAAESIHHRQERVKNLGVMLITPKEAKREAKKRNTSLYKTGDIVVEDILTMVKSMGIEPIFDFFGICVQDHGRPRRDISSLDFRHHIFKGIIEKDPHPSAFLFEADGIPSCLRRMRSAAMDAKEVSSGKIYLMDTGMAAVLGASSDPSARGKRSIVVLDIASSHTLGALLLDGEIGGFFEYHTRAITPGILKTLIIDLAGGRLSHERILSEGGHGAYTRKTVGFDEVEMILATGPKRRILRQIEIEGIVLGAPFGDNMMTGTAGLILAMAEREGVSLGDDFGGTG